MLEDPLPWSLRRHLAFQRCPRLYFLRYIASVGLPLNMDSEVQQNTLLMDAREMTPPLHWSTAILKSVHEAMARVPQLTPTMLEYTSRHYLETYTDLSKSDIRYLLSQMQKGDWFAQLAARIAVPFHVIPVDQYQFITYRDTTIRLLPSIAFDYGAIAVMFRCEEHVTSFTPFSDVLNFLFVRHRLAWNVKELRIRVLSLARDTQSEGVWSERIINENNVLPFDEFLNQSVKNLHIQQTYSAIKDSDFPCISDEISCTMCPFYAKICDSSKL